MLERTDWMSLILKGIGAMPSLKFTFDTGMRYNGMVTITWEGDCEGARDETGYPPSSEGNTTHLGLYFRIYQYIKPALNRTAWNINIHAKWINTKPLAKREYSTGRQNVLRNQPVSQHNRN